jgi:hypothetical protein
MNVLPSTTANACPIGLAISLFILPPVLFFKKPLVSRIDRHSTDLWLSPTRPKAITQHVKMGFLREKRIANLASHVIEIRGFNLIFSGLVYKLYFDGEEVAAAQNFWKIPTQRSLEAWVSVDGMKRHIIVSVKQRWLSTEYALTIDGESLALE